MLEAIVRFSLRFRGIIIALACVGAGYGLFVALHAKLDVFPDFVPPQATVQTEAPGLAPEQVEQLVTRPLESAINGLGNQESLRSESIQGLSVITVVFKHGTNLFQARQLLAEKLGAAAGALPAGVKAPRMAPLTSATMDLLKIGLVSDRQTPMQLRTLADWTLRPRLLAVPGVADCKIFGGEVRQWQIRVQPDLLVARNLTLSDVLTAARSASGVRGAGFIDTPAQRVVLQTEGQALTAAALANVVVAAPPGGAPVRLGDVATVVEGAEPKFGDALIMGRPGVLMTMSSQYGANTREVTVDLERALDELKPLLAREGVTLYPALHRPATFIEAALGNIEHSLLLGAALVAAVLFLFLGHVRTALISLTAIPLALLTAVVVLDRLGVSLNTMTLGGLAIAIGEVVDDAIIGVENILRRLRENTVPARPRPVAAVILDAAVEVRAPVVFATAVVALVFLPVLTLSGLQGSFFAPLAQSYILAVLASLVVALTVTPALALIFFARGTRDTEVPWLQRALRRGYERLLTWLAGHRPLVPVGAVFLFCAFALSRLPYLSGEFLPEFREGHFVLGVSTAPGASLEEMLRLGRQISSELLRNPNIATVEQQAGRAELGEDAWPTHRSEIHVELKPNLSGAAQARVEEEIRAVLEKVPGIQFEVLTFLGDRIGETIGGETAPIVVNLFGEELDALDAKAVEVKQVLVGLRAQDVQVKSPPGAPRLNIRLRPERLTALGFRPVEVLEFVQTACEGETVAQVYEGNRTTDVAVILDPASHRDPETLGGLLLTSATGRRVPLREIADVYLADGRASILHEGARRRQTVTCSPPAGRDVESFAREARAAVARKVSLPPGMYVEFAGAAEAKRQATHELLLHGAVALVGIVLLLAVAVGRMGSEEAGGPDRRWMGRVMTRVIGPQWPNLFLVLVNLPLALAGGVMTVYVMTVLGRGALSMGALVGFVTLFGLTTRNSILLIAHYEHLVTVEGATWNLATAIRGASERLVPILMTASVTALGLLPLALGSGEAGREIEGPMAQVILGGLCTSTGLNLLVLPLLALRWARWSPEPRRMADASG